ncbi:MAG: hypothetical protein LBR06_00850 [Bacteroidales bacterium]|jgi:hypothetical protein|nr:hypothetical protein [Bacteroidales bacterium]
MKRLILFFFLLLSLAGNSGAQETKERNWTISLGPSLVTVSRAEFGFSISGFYRLAGRHQLGLEYSVHGHSESAGTYSYVIEGSSTVHTDGKMKRSYSVIPVLASYSLLQTTHSDKFQWYYGLAIGAMPVNARDSYELPSGVSSMENLPEDRNERSISAFCIGPMVGAIVSISPKWVLRANLKLIAHPNKQLENLKTGVVSGLLGISAGYRF